MFVLSFDTIYLFEILILIETLNNNEQMSLYVIK
jgi:hypothetical protein